MIMIYFTMEFLTQFCIEPYVPREPQWDPKIVGSNDMGYEEFKVLILGYFKID